MPSQGNLGKYPVTQDVDLALITAAWPSNRFPATGCFIRNLSDGFSDLGLKVTIIAPAPKSHEDHARSVYRFSNPLGRPKLHKPDFILGLLYLVSAVRTCRKVIHKTRPKAVLVHWVVPAGPAALAAVRFINVPFFVWAHGSDLEVYADRSRFFAFLASMVLKKSHTVFTVSKSLKDKALALGAKRVKLLPMGVASHFKSSPINKQANREDFTVLFVGDLIPGKGVRTVLKSMSIIRTKKKIGNIKFVFVGAGPLRNEVTKSGASHYANVNSNGVMELLDKSSILVLPSRSEGMPLSVLEALCRGVPVIASNVGGIPERITHCKQGLLLSSPGDAMELAGFIVKIHNNKDLWEKLHKEALKSRKEILTVREVAESFLNEIREAAEL